MSTSHLDLDSQGKRDVVVSPQSEAKHLPSFREALELIVHSKKGFRSLLSFLRSDRPSASPTDAVFAGGDEAVDSLTGKIPAEHAEAIFSDLESAHQLGKEGLVDAVFSDSTSDQLVTQVKADAARALHGSHTKKPTRRRIGMPGGIEELSQR